MHEYFMFQFTLFLHHFFTLLLLGKMPTSAPDRANLMGASPDLGCDKMYCDARDSIHMYQQILAGPTENWHQINQMRQGIPNYVPWTFSVGQSPIFFQNSTILGSIFQSPKN